MFAVTFEEPLFDIVLPVINPSEPPPHKTSPWGFLKVTGTKVKSIGIVIKFAGLQAWNHFLIKRKAIRGLLPRDPSFTRKLPK